MHFDTSQVKDVAIIKAEAASRHCRLAVAGAPDFLSRPVSSHTQDGELKPQAAGKGLSE